MPNPKARFPSLTDAESDVSACNVVRKKKKNEIKKLNFLILTTNQIHNKISVFPRNKKMAFFHIVTDIAQ